MLLDLWEQIVGVCPTYFTQGTSSSIQWHYGELLQYCFVSLTAIICIAMVFRLIFTIMGLFGHKH